MSAAAATALRQRADSYAHDAASLRHAGMTDEALIYEAITAELRKVATDMEDPT